MAHTSNQPVTETEQQQDASSTPSSPTVAGLAHTLHTSNQPATEAEIHSVSSKTRRLPKDRKNKIVRAAPSPTKTPSTSSPVAIPVGRPIRNSEERDAVNRAIEQRIRDQEAELQLDEMREQAKEFRRTRNRRNTETENLIASQQQQGRQESFANLSQGKGKAGARRRAQTKFFGSAVDSQKAISRSPRKRADPKKTARVDHQLTQHAKQLTSKLDVMSLSQLQQEEGAESSFDQSSPEKSSPEKSPEKH